MCLRRCAFALVAVPLLLAAALGCSRARTAPHQTGATSNRLAKAGLRVVLPRGWYGRIVLADPGFPNHALEAGNFQLVPLDGPLEVPSTTGLQRSQVRLVLLEVGNPPGRRFPPMRHIRPLSRTDFGRPPPAVPLAHAWAGRHFSQGGRSFSLMVEFGVRPAPEHLLRATDELLASLRIRGNPWANPAYWRPVRRPITLRRLVGGQGCRPSRAVNGIPRVATALGRGPAYAVLGSAKGADLTGEIVRAGWHYHKTLWAFAPRYKGPLLIRGRRLDAVGGVRFALGGRPILEIRVPPTASGRRWRYLPSDALFAAEGCYGFQIDGRGFSEKIVFRVSLGAARPPRTLSRRRQRRLSACAGSIPAQGSRIHLSLLLVRDAGDEEDRCDLSSRSPQT
jgi:hypothetical protein